MKHKKLHIPSDEAVIHINPAVVSCIGINEAMIFQKIGDWIQKIEAIENGKFSKEEKDDLYIELTYVVLPCPTKDNKTENAVFIKFDYKEWEHQFYFWPEDTIKTLLTSLEKKGGLISSQDTKGQTKWYSQYSLSRKNPLPLIELN